MENLHKTYVFPSIRESATFIRASEKKFPHSNYRWFDKVKVKVTITAPDEYIKAVNSRKTAIDKIAKKHDGKADEGEAGKWRNNRWLAQRP